MKHRVTLRDVAVKDFRALDGETQRQARRQFEKLGRNPELGANLGNKLGIDLTGYRALHFGRNRYRIVYRSLREEAEVEVWGIAKREVGAVYRMVARRIDEARDEATGC